MYIYTYIYICIYIHIYIYQATHNPCNWSNAIYTSKQVTTSYKKLKHVTNDFADEKKRRKKLV